MRALVKNQSIHTLLLWIAAGGGLIALHILLMVVSKGFGYSLPLSEQPIWNFVVIESAAGAVFFVSMLMLRRSDVMPFPGSTGNTNGMSLPMPTASVNSLRSHSVDVATSHSQVRKGVGSRPLLGWILCVGAILRVVMMWSDPGLEYDYYRYMWDGAVLANGVSPFRYAPLEVSRGDEDVPPRLRALARESGEVLTRVSFPHLRTIYPPTAQAVFAAAYLMRPWRLDGLRLIFLLFDVATLALLLVALRDLHLSPLQIAVYWWNPLVVLEIYNSPHLDIVSLTLAVGAVLLAGRKRHVAACAVLAFAVGVKIWPVVLVPVIVWPLRKDLPRLSAALGMFVCACAVLFLPVMASGLNISSGFVAYGQFWEMNDSLYRLLLTGVKAVLTAFLADTGAAQTIARALALGILCTWAVWVPATDRANSSSAPWRQSLPIAAAVFLLSPTAFPWYFLWIIPWLTVNPRISLLALNCTLPLYYLSYYARARNSPAIFDQWVVWIEYVPFGILAVREWLESRRNRPKTVE